MKDYDRFLSISLVVIIGVIIITLCHKQVKEHLLQDDPMLEHLRLILINVHPIVGELKLYKADKSYTLNKEKIFLCLKDSNNNNYPQNMLIYVALHEIAHVLCTSQGHTPEFYAIFEQLLAKAKELGVYTDKIPQVKNYRGSSES